ncbi:uncharacterized protein LOC143218889 [Lasioglossum baleicum]|uniref:uncharacterized protein LOC143218889 n=1 Tax=Lasioglossum baleicum TaxID=434251 RepID=UPI003FCED11D
MDALKSLVAERGTVKVRLTIFRKFVESADVSADIVAFEKRVRANEGIYGKFDAVQSQIEAAVIDTPHQEAQFAKREQFEASYFRTVSGAEARLMTARGNSAPGPSSANSATPESSDSPPSTRLPIIKLPSFDGDVGKWIRFRDTFNSSVNNSEKLTDIDRFNYLVASLSGPAARAIESYSVSAANYKLAWARLKERYNDPKALIAHHIKSLLEIKPIKGSNGTALGELIDTVVNNLRALESLLKPQEILDAIISACLAKGLDSDSLDEWDKRAMETRAMPSLKAFTAFLEKRAQYLIRKNANRLSGSGISVDRPKTSKPRDGPNRDYVAAAHVASKLSKCVLCNGDHTLQYCAKWLAMPFSERHDTVKRSYLCFNCLSPGHSIKACTRGKCRKCSRKHHTLLHREDAGINDMEENEESPVSSTSHVVHSGIANSAEVGSECTVLSTALVYVIDSKGNNHKCRALLDVGSQANFVSREFFDRIALPRRAVETMVGGLGRVRNPIRSTAQLRIASSRADFKANLSCLVIEKITEEMPNVPLNKVSVPIPAGVVPADPDFYTSGRVDLLIGACLFWDLLCVGQIKVGLGNLMWQKTRLGWVLGGSMPWANRHLDGKKLRACHVVTNAQLEKSVSRFWEVEEIGNIGAIKHNDPCEQHFKKHTTRDKKGHFVVSIPFNERVHELGESRTQAERRLLNLERKFRRNPDLEKQYKDFLREYIELGYMTKLETKDASRVENSFHLPHHAVLKEDSTTTNLRVVFDGSAKTSTGVSLNDTQIAGLPVQDDLFSILIRFRSHKIVLSADIAKMYRQVVVREQDRRYQGILWRFSEDEDIGTYSLNTVTYGTASASYLATRVLQQVGKDCARSAPSVSKAILRDFYVDDLQLAASVLREPLVIELIARYSCYSKLLRIVTYIFRFIGNTRPQRGSRDSQSNHRRPPSVIELASAERVVIKTTQERFFSKEMRQLKAGRSVGRDSSLLSLHPILDDHGIIRVGGRLQNAPMAFDQKHPIIVPKSGPLATLLIRREHLRLLHAGFQQTFASLHSTYWLVSGRRVTRKVLINCIKRFRSSPHGTQPRIGNLPADRVTPARAFATCGVDYAGPFLIVELGRARTARKAYICLFVCMVTKAVHIELAVDLTTDAFLNCLNRFISRRGRCQAIYSDNGTNFVGSRNELKELGILLSSRQHHDRILEVLAQEGIEWHFIPPRAPHFGGLWERGVRSIKTHMKRVIGEQKLTFEEMYTMLTQIEPCLNSRPLHPLSSDPSDLNPLTPGHFLVGEALTALPQADLAQITQNRLSRFQILQQMIQHFWKRWQRDYLHGLQQRQRWKSDSPDAPTLGAMVLIKEDNLPPMKWALGRILELHLGQDSVTRVVSIRTATGVIKRPVAKICLLPIAEEHLDTESA